MKIIDIKTICTEKLGSLSFFESCKDVPFDIKRIYYIYNVSKDCRRGGHAHKSLTQLLFCPYGSINVILDDGHTKKEVLLNSPSKGLVITNGIWRDMLWEKDDSVLCVAASDYYNEFDYIRDYNEFLRYVKEGYWENEN